ncbi:MAG: hypothetical protein A4E62_02058 [Syntrophorhabdus sp. PtaU1.Bin002]|nr:MAG: hypothetical protein A4E62_02058 [Syntrophorhabdus sp. PtaU1.Bin002]
MASAKFAKRTVNQSHRDIWRTKAKVSLPDGKTRPMAVITAPTSVTNMTGFFSSDRGFNFLKESAVA